IDLACVHSVSANVVVINVMTNRHICISTVRFSLSIHPHVSRQSAVSSLQSADSNLFCLLLFDVYYVVVLAQVIVYSLLETGDWLLETDLATSSAVVVV